MEPYERIRHLRKGLLKLTLEDFSRQINMSRSNLGNIETGKIHLTDRVLSDLCREFHVRPDWIMNGNDPVFEESPNPLDSEIIRLYTSLTNENRAYLYGYMQRLAAEPNRP